MGVHVEGSLVRFLFLCIHPIDLCFVVQYKPFFNAYRVFGDPNWDDLVSIFTPNHNGEGDQGNEDVILLSSETSEDNDTNPNVTDGNEQNVVQDPSTSTSTAESRVLQRSLGDYVRYVADSDSSMNSGLSTKQTFSPNPCRSPSPVACNSAHSWYLDRYPQQHGRIKGPKFWLIILFVNGCGCWGSYYVFYPCNMLS